MFIYRPHADCANYEASQWSYLVQALDLTELTRSELGARPIVVVQPSSGRFVPGTVPLNEFNHLKEAVYVFGSDHRNMVEGDLRGLNIISHVYIPADPQWDLYSTQAAAIVAWDWRLQHG